MTSQIIHTNRLVSSLTAEHVLYNQRINTVQLGVEVESRVADLFGAYRRVNEQDLAVPEDVFPDMVRWREMRIRHNKGDFRHSDIEQRSMEAVMRWALAEHKKLRNQGD